MSVWLISIVGVTVIGVLIELLLTDSPMSKFVRSVYAFFILFVIVQPLPSFIKSASQSVSGDIVLDTNLLSSIDSQTKIALANSVKEALDSEGFEDCIVVFFEDKIYVNAYNTTNKDEDKIISIVMSVCNIGADVVEVFI